MYDDAYYSRPIPENWFAQFALPRPDELAAICYAFGMPFWGDEPPTYLPRDPGLTLSIGSGLGNMEVALERCGVEVIGSDPAPGARERYQGSRFFHLGAADAVACVSARTIIFCESLEHIPRPVLNTAWSMLTTRPCRVIVVNWPMRHPIPVDPSGWDHITQVDDALFGELSAPGTIILQRNSHLVVEFAP